MNMKLDYKLEIDKFNKDLPKVSIIIPTYRREDSLKRALVSLANQTYSNIEIIVVDDNANNSWNSKVEDIIKGMNKKENVSIIYVQNRENKGSAETRNIGIKKATGEFITFLDDDDIYLPDKVERQVNHMIENDSDYSLTDLWLYDEKDNLIEKRVRDYIKDYSLESLERYHIMYHMTGTDTMMFRKEYLLEIGIFSPIDVGDEFYLMHKAIKGNGKFSYLPVCDVKAYVHNEISGLSSGDGKIKGENELFEYKKQYFSLLKDKDKRYIKMRHYAVLAFAELRRKDYFAFIGYSMKSFFSSPINLMYIVINRK